MRLVIISDTHGMHRELKNLSGDVLVHCGDFCHGHHVNMTDLQDVDQWFACLDFERILCVGGNHDFAAQELASRGEPVFKNAIYLEDEIHKFGGLTFYGTPWLPALPGWAFYLPNSERKAKWKLIPRDTDILITHTPPMGILDKPRFGISIGCPYLRAKVNKLELKVHCFGHVHASNGLWEDASTTFVNASVINSNYEIAHPPFIVDL